MRRRGFANPELLVLIALAAILLAIAMPVYSNTFRLLERQGASANLGTHLLALFAALVMVVLVPAVLCALCMLAEAGFSLLRKRRSRDVTRAVRLIGVLACSLAALACIPLVLRSAAGAAPGPVPAPLGTAWNLGLCVACLAAAAVFFPRE